MPVAPQTLRFRNSTPLAMAIALVLTAGCDEPTTAPTVTGTVTVLTDDAPAQRVVLDVQAPTRDLDEANVAQAIRNRLKTTLGAHATSMTVSVDGRVATLDGTVKTLAAAMRAADVAAMIAGVERVEVTTTVATPSIDDDMLRHRVQAALVAAPATRTTPIAVAADDGKVTLRGRVGSFQERVGAERTTAAIEGVTAIDNELSVLVARERPDPEIESDIQSALDWDARIRADRIQIDVSDGIATLSGSVRSLAERHRAAELAWVAGVKKVDADGIGITWWERSRMDKLAMPSLEDEELTALIERRFAFDPRVPHTNVEAHAKDDVIILAGSVPTYAIKRAAEEIVRHLRIRSVDNNIVVKTDPLADALLEEQLEARIDRNPWVAAADVNVEVTDGNVTLLGRVDTELEVLEAELAIADHAGVTDIDNQLSIDGLATAPPGDDEALATAIDLALSHDPFVDATGVRIEVEDGAVRLAGTVDEPARERAVQAAHDAGAISVDATDLILRESS